MSKVIKIKKGLDIKLHGKAEFTVTEVHSKQYALKPTDYHGVFPKLLVKEGDQVLAGTPCYFDKYNEQIKFCAPVSGTVTEIKRGAKRVIEEIRIEADNNLEFVSFEKGHPNSLSRDEIVSRLLDSGVWPVILQRPYTVIAQPNAKPKAIYVSAFDSAPLAADYNFLLDNEKANFQAGLDALARLTDGQVHLGVHETHTQSDVFLKAQGVQIDTFAGPHPSGNTGIQIHHTEPINKGEVVWTVKAQDVVTIGRLFLEGQYNTRRLVALTGSEVEKTGYYQVMAGVSIKQLVKDKLKQTHVRYISGNVLTGKRIQADGYLGAFDAQFTVIPEGDYYEFLGWALPGIGKFSFSRSFFSWLTPNKKYPLDTNLHGGERAFVFTGIYEKVLPMDILPMQLLKSILVEDIDQMENLGIYEVDEEDFALCEVVCPSKIEIQSIIRNGLDLVRKEMS